jgi:hypothetical protein
MTVLPLATLGGVTEIAGNTKVFPGDRIISIYGRIGQGITLPKETQL